MTESVSRRNFLRGLLLAPASLALTIFSPALFSPPLAQRTLGVREGLGVGLEVGQGVDSAQPPLAVDPVSLHTRPSIIYVNP